MLKHWHLKASAVCSIKKCPKEVWAFFVVVRGVQPKWLVSATLNDHLTQYVKMRLIASLPSKCPTTKNVRTRFRD